MITVKPGDEVEVLVKSMETADGLPVLSRADAVRMKAWDDLKKLTERHDRQGPRYRAHQRRTARRHRWHCGVPAGFAGGCAAGAES